MKSLWKSENIVYNFVIDHMIQQKIFFLFERNFNPFFITFNNLID